MCTCLLHSEKVLFATSSQVQVKITHSNSTVPLYEVIKSHQLPLQCHWYSCTFTMCYDVTSWHNTNCPACATFFPWLSCYLTTAVSCISSNIKAPDGQKWDSPSFPIRLVCRYLPWLGWLLYMSAYKFSLGCVWSLHEESLLTRSNTNYVTVIVS